MKIYSKCFSGGSAKEFCDHVFRTFDRKTNWQSFFVFTSFLRIIFFEQIMNLCWFFSDKNGFIDFKEFLLAIDVTSSGTPEQKLNWAFKYRHFWELHCHEFTFRMYDVDENGFIDLNEMTKLVRSIYQVSGAHQKQVFKKISQQCWWLFFVLETEWVCRQQSCEYF